MTGQERAGATEAWPFGALKPEHYRVILIDPPWNFENRSAKGEKKHPKNHYRTLSLGEICNFPVWKLADPKGALLVMWSTWSFMAQGHHLSVLKRWQFRPSSGGVWVKVTANACPAFGTGYVLRDACEPFFTGVRRRLPAGCSKAERNVIFGPLRDHSAKPPEMHEMLERLSPGPRCELFAMSERPGWDVWGDQVGRRADGRDVCGEGKA